MNEPQGQTTTLFVSPRLTFRQELAKAAMQALIRQVPVKGGEGTKVMFSADMAWNIADEMIARENANKNG